MARFYSKNAILLATFDTLLRGKKEIYEYFVDFIDKDNMRCRILENFTLIDRDRDTKIANGLYEFTFTENGKPQKVIARYTFVINSRRINTQHSSLKPESE